MVVVYENDDTISAFTVDEIVSVERIPLENIESTNNKDQGLSGQIARREKNSEILTIIHPEILSYNQEG